VQRYSPESRYEEHDGDAGSFLATATNMDHFIESVVATADTVRAELGRTKRINISFDEWNVWYNARHDSEQQITDIERWPTAPRLLENAYSVLDAVVVGNLLISLLKHADRVTAASLAQLVNVIAPIMTEPGGPAWRQTTFFPFAITSRLAVGDALEVRLTCDTYETSVYGEVPLVDAVATHDPNTGRTAIFLVTGP
jgi:alpha-N-arabinofuranosidase